MEYYIDQIIQNRYALLITITASFVAILIYLYYAGKFIFGYLKRVFRWSVEKEELRIDRENSRIALSSHDGHFFAVDFLLRLAVLALAILITQFVKELSSELTLEKDANPLEIAFYTFVNLARPLMHLIVGLYAGETIWFVRLVRQNRFEILKRKFPKAKDWEI